MHRMSEKWRERLRFRTTLPQAKSIGTILWIQAHLLQLWYDRPKSCNAGPHTKFMYTRSPRSVLADHFPLVVTLIATSKLPQSILSRSLSLPSKFHVTSDTMEDAQKLPDEIIFRIIEDCIEAYSIRLCQLAGHAREYSSTPIGSYTNQWPPLQPTILPSPRQNFGQRSEVEKISLGQHQTSCSNGFMIRNFASRGLEVWSGLPDVVNLILVSKMFHHEVMRTLKQKFDGRLMITRMEECHEERRCSIGVASACVIRDATGLSWLKPLIKEITIDRGCSRTPHYSILAAAETPNLHRLVIQTKLPFLLRNIDLSGKDDDKVVQCLENHFDNEGRWGFNISPHRARQIELLAEATICTRQFLEQDGEIKLHFEMSKFKVDLTKPGVYEIKHRQKLHSLWTEKSSSYRWSNRGILTIYPRRAI